MRKKPGVHSKVGSGRAHGGGLHEKKMRAYNHIEQLFKRKALRGLRAEMEPERG